jgi:hypothetical protein
MEIYEIFGDYLNKSKQIRQFCEKDENLLFESLRMDIPSDAVKRYLTSVGKEIDLVLDFIEKMKTDRESDIATLIKHC